MTQTYDPVPVVAKELRLEAAKVAAALKLLDEGNTIPFIARYRKEATRGLDEVQLRDIQDRASYARELEERRGVILRSIEEQGKLSDELRAQLAACVTKAELEDLYLPFRPRRRTRATAARERGLSPLAERIRSQPADGDPAAEAAAFVDPDKELSDVAEALAGARDIVAEQISELAEVRAQLRRHLAERGQLASAAVPEKTTKPTKFEAYYDHREPIAKAPSHRFLALRRGERAGILKVRVEADSERQVSELLRRVGHDASSPFAAELETAARDSLKRLLLPSIGSDVLKSTKERADRTAVKVFASNLRSLLLAAPLGARSVIGVDPGLRTGCKCVALDGTGKLLEHLTIYPFKGRDGDAQTGAAAALVELVRRHQPFAVAVGNGTGGRETESLAREALREAELGEIVVVSVNEAGASVYSASDLARAELPELDVSVRGAVSIARRLQDPLAELVKIEPKSIGVGQYQHDVHQPLLKQKLSDVVESCVNHVGVELNTASPSLLRHVAGVGPRVAAKIVEHRDAIGGYRRRDQLLQVAGLGERTYQQAAGFLRIRGGEQPLDASAVHPERYELVERIAQDVGVALADLVGRGDGLDGVDPERYVSAEAGRPTIDDILDELRKPGRDPRAEFTPPEFRDDVSKLEDLQVGMELEGVVTNVTAFGAFVDVGVHQDGLIHISRLTAGFISDPSQVVQVGQRLKTQVLSVDLERQRISLTVAGVDGKPKRPRRRAPGRPAEGKPARRDARTGGKAKRKVDHPRAADKSRPRRGKARPGTSERSGERRDRPGEKSRAPAAAGEADRFTNNPFAVLKKKP